MVYEYQCQNAACEQFELTRDHYAPRFDSPPPNCPACARPMSRVFLTPPAAIWCRAAGEYGDKSKEGYNPDGFWMYRRESTRNADGSPEKVWVDSVAKQREICKAEGLRMPDEINPNAQLDRDGKTLRTTGLPGQWGSTPSLMIDNDKQTGHLEGWV